MTEVMNTREPVMEEFILSQPEEEGGTSTQVSVCLQIEYKATVRQDPIFKVCQNNLAS